MSENGRAKAAQNDLSDLRKVAESARQVSTGEASGQRGGCKGNLRESD